jgi:hypothetical protein
LARDRRSERNRYRPDQTIRRIDCKMFFQIARSRSCQILPAIAGAFDNAHFLVSQGGLAILNRAMTERPQDCEGVSRAIEAGAGLGSD